MSFKGTKQFKAEFRRYFLLVLVLLYALGFLQTDSIHKLFHGHSDGALHTEEQEKNACHRVGVHNVPTEDCSHPTHLSENKKCPFCPGSKESDQLLLLATYSSDHTQDVKNKSLKPEQAYSIALVHKESRGPPTV